MRELVLGKNHIITGRNSLNYLKKLDIGKVFLMTGYKSMFKNGTIESIRQILSYKNCPFYIYSGITKNSDSGVIIDALQAIKKFKPNTVLAIGGGSVINTSKIITVMYEYSYINFKNILFMKLPEFRNYVKLIAIPSTSGTGSEVTDVCLVTLKDSNIRIKLETQAFVPDIAILDPNITLSMSQDTVAQTGMSAMVHAIECYMNESLDDISECLAREAIKGLFKYLPLSYESQNIKYREKVHNYQCIAGFAFNNISDEIVDGIISCVSINFNLGYGLVNAVALPYILEYKVRNIEIVSRLKKLGKYIEADDFISSIRRLNSKLNIPKSLKEVGVDEQKFENSLFMLVQNAFKYSINASHIKILEEDVVKILKCIYYGHNIDF